MFGDYLDRWALAPDGNPIVTATSRLLPVRRQGVPAMLKLATAPEEKAGSALMAWWDGKGAARVLAHEGDAILLERAAGELSLAALARNGCDDEASRILCAVAAMLHEPATKPLPDLVPLTRWFEGLGHAAATQGGVLAMSAATARELLATPRDIGVLHGDLHHGNILHFGTRGWLAIDPKGLLGERGFDYANLFCNPDPETATAPGRLARQVEIVADAAKLERRRLLQWVLAWAGLSAAFCLQDGTPPQTAIALAEIAAAQLRA
jgi:streptomycin 6-kinase